VAERHTQAA